MSLGCSPCPGTTPRGLACAAAPHAPAPVSVPQCDGPGPSAVPMPQCRRMSAYGPWHGGHGRCCWGGPWGLAFGYGPWCWGMGHWALAGAVGTCAGLLLTTRHHLGGRVPHHSPPPQTHPPPPRPLKGLGQTFSGSSADQNFSLAALAPVSVNHAFSLVPLTTQHHRTLGGLDRPPPLPQGALDMGREGTPSHGAVAHSQDASISGT